MSSKGSGQTSSSGQGETIYQPRVLSRMDLPPEEYTFFQEEQAFDQIWLWVLMSIEMVAILVPIVLAKLPVMAMFIGLGAMALTFAILGSLRLRTRMDREGVHYQMRFFHRKERTIPWQEIEQIYVRQYSPILEYGGWGIRYGLKGRAYTVKGTNGIQLVKKDGKRILLGTQKPEEAAAYLGKSPLLV